MDNLLPDFVHTALFVRTPDQLQGAEDDLRRAYSQLARDPNFQLILQDLMAYAMEREEDSRGERRLIRRIIHQTKAAESYYRQRREA